MGRQTTKEQELAAADKRLQRQLIKSRAVSVKMVVDRVAPDEPSTIENVKFVRDSVVMTVRWPFSLSEVTHDAGEYLGERSWQEAI
jgi:hypothetical protein